MRASVIQPHASVESSSLDQTNHLDSKLRFSTSDVQPYELQAQQLGDSLRKYAPSFPGPYVLIGHSNGGLVSRYTAQNFNGDPSLIRGVMSVSSPHGGAPLANLTSQQVSAAVAIPTLAFAGCNYNATLACQRLATLTGYAAGSVVAILSPFFFQANPILEQMKPGSAFQAAINARGNPTRVASVRNTAWNRWTIARLAGDHFKCGTNVIDCGDNAGRRYVETTDKAWHVATVCYVVGTLTGIVWAPGRTAAKVCGQTAAGMRAVDLSWRAISVGNAQGDAVVPEWSQYFPGAAPDAQYRADDSDSHLGVSSSGRYTGIVMKQALVTTFGVAITNP